MEPFDVPIKRYMRQAHVVVRADDRLHIAQERLRKHQLNGLPVVDDEQRPVGVITQTDLLRIETVPAVTGAAERKLMLPDVTVSQVMTRHPLTLPVDETLATAARLMRDHNVNRILVVEGQRLAGVVNAWGLVQRAVEIRTMVPVESIMTSSVATAEAQEMVEPTIARMRQHKIHGIVVVHHGWPIGVFTQREALQAELQPERAPMEHWASPAVLAMPRDLPAHRAAAQALATGARYMVVIDRQGIHGLVTPTSFARLQRS